MQIANIYRGDIFYIKKFYTTGSEQEPGRPAVIVSNDMANANSDVVEIVYLTTKNKKPLPTHTEVIANIPSTVLCEKIYSVSKEKLGDYVRSCTDAEMERINKCLAISIGLDGLTETAQNISGGHEPEKTEAPEPEKAPQDVETYEKLLKTEAERDVYKELYYSLLEKAGVR